MSNQSFVHNETDQIGQTDQNPVMVARQHVIKMMMSRAEDQDDRQADIYLAVWIGTLLLLSCLALMVGYAKIWIKPCSTAALESDDHRQTARESRASSIWQHRSYQAAARRATMEPSSYITLDTLMNTPSPPTGWVYPASHPTRMSPWSRQWSC